MLQRFFNVVAINNSKGGQTISGVAACFAVVSLALSAAGCTPDNDNSATDKPIPDKYQKKIYDMMREADYDVFLTNVEEFEDEDGKDMERYYMEYDYKIYLSGCTRDKAKIETELIITRKDAVEYKKFDSLPAAYTEESAKNIFRFRNEKEIRRALRFLQIKQKYMTMEQFNSQGAADKSIDVMEEFPSIIQKRSYKRVGLATDLKDIRISMTKSDKEIKCLEYATLKPVNDYGVGLKIK
jgi:hypothetical protein